MSYRIAAIVALSVLLGGCAGAAQGTLRTAVPGSSIEPQPTDPQCGACSRVYVTSTQELYVFVDKEGPLPAVDLSLHTATGKTISNHRGLEPRMLEPGKAVYRVEGGPEADVGYGLLTWTTAAAGASSETVAVQTSWMGFPTDAGDYHLETRAKRVSFGSDAPGARRRSEPAEEAPTKAKAEIAKAPAKALRASRPRSAPRTNVAQDRARPSAPRHVVLSRRTGRSHVTAKR